MTNQNQTTTTCKICGAPRDPLHSNCKYCGTVYAADKIIGEAYIVRLRTLLTTIEQEERSKRSFIEEFTGNGETSAMLRVAQRQASAISTFAMPSDVESLLQFLAFCHGNAQMTVGLHDSAGDRVKGAWHGKAKMAFTQLKLKTIANPLLAPYIAEHEILYGVMAKKPMSADAKIMIGLVTSIVVCFTFFGIMIIDESRGIAREHDRLATIIRVVQTQIVAGQFDAAEANCADINWTWDLVKNSSQETAKVYDQKRKDLKSLIAEARKNAGKR